MVSFLAKEKYYFKKKFCFYQTIFGLRFDVCLVAVGTSHTTGPKHRRERPLTHTNITIVPEIITKSPSDENLDFTNRELLINPGNKYIIDEDDICVFISLVREEEYDFKTSKQINSGTFSN